MSVKEKVRRRLGFSGHPSMTAKATLNAAAAALDYGARLVVGFLTTPLMVRGLGESLFGTWQVLTRLLGYISPASGRPTQALKWTIAREQSSTDYDQKSRFVGSALVVWALFLPLMLVLGGVLVWQAPFWLKTPAANVLQVRLCIGVLVGTLAITSLTEIPLSVLQGENLGYKRMGLSTLTILLGGGLIWLAVALHTGLVGIAASSLITTLLSGAVFFRAVRKHAGWFRIVIPPFSETRRFFRLSLWFQGWNLVMNLMTASDVVILGLLLSVESVADYSLSKYAPETLASLIALMNFGVTPGLGGVIGSGRLKRAVEVRGELMALTWLATTALGATILVWNRAFLGLWVGPGHYIGAIPLLLVAIVVTQFVLIRCDSGFIDLTLDLRRKVTLGLASSGVAVAVSILFVGPFKMGYVGLSLGLIIGRLMLSLEYPAIVGRFLGVTRASQLRSVVRPALVTFALYGLGTWLGTLVSLGRGPVLRGWIVLAAGVAATAALFLGAGLGAGLSGPQRRAIYRRVRDLVSPMERRPAPAD